MASRVSYSHIPKLYVWYNSLMKAWHLVLIALVVVGLVYAVVIEVEGGLRWVRASYPHAKHCYPVGQEPKTIVHKVYYADFDSCNSTLED